MFTFVIIHQTHKRFIIEVIEDTPLHKMLGQNLVSGLVLQSIYGALETAGGSVKCDIFFQNRPKN